jgi:hypothetical protein
MSACLFHTMAARQAQGGGGESDDERSQAPPTTAASQGGATNRMVVCQHCLQRFSPAEVSECRRHAGSWAGFERGKLFGGRTQDFPHVPRVYYHWDCCGQVDERAPGCLAGAHESFDGELSLPGDAPRANASVP